MSLKQMHQIVCTVVSRWTEAGTFIWK